MRVHRKRVVVTTALFLLFLYLGLLSSSHRAVLSASRIADSVRHAPERLSSSEQAQQPQERDVQSVPTLPTLLRGKDTPTVVEEAVAGNDNDGQAPHAQEKQIASRAEGTGVLTSWKADFIHVNASARLPNQGRNIGTTDEVGDGGGWVD